MSGSVEAAPSLGLADAVVDLVETGTTMRAAGLEVVEEVLATEAIVIQSAHASHPELVEKILKRIDGFMTSQKFQMIQYNMPRSKLADAMRVTPGKRSPTVSPLEDPEWSAVSSLVPAKEAHQIMDDLEAVGATDILLFALSNSRM